jgi:hypothetical protein
VKIVAANTWSCFAGLLVFAVCGAETRQYQSSKIAINTNAMDAAISFPQLPGQYSMVHIYHFGNGFLRHI